MDYDSFIFTHIPKCGGSSFRRFIHECAIHSGINTAAIHIPGEGGVPHDANISQLDASAFKQLQSKKLKILADHSKYEPSLYHQLGFKQPFVYTIFRDPKERFISHYNFFYKKNGHGNCKGKEFKDLSDSKLIAIIKNLANVQCAYLLGIDPGHGQEHLVEERFEEVVKLLETKVSCFGILEKMPESMHLLFQKKPTWLQIKTELPKINTNAVNSKKIVYGRVNKFFGEYNRFDNELYRIALEKFEEEVSLK